MFWAQFAHHQGAKESYVTLFEFSLLQVAELPKIPQCGIYIYMYIYI